MEQSEIRIISSGDGVDVHVDGVSRLNPRSLFDGLLAHVDIVAQILNKDRMFVTFFLDKFIDKWEANPDAVERESFRIIIPKGLNLSGKEEQ